jgi:hypothetical protein
VVNSTLAPRVSLSERQNRMKNISKCLMVLGLALSLVGCVMEDEPQTLEVDDVRVAQIENGEVTAENEYSPECAPLPGGSYRLTCSTVVVACDGSWMDAYCRRRNGTWKWSTLWYPFSCTRDIANIDGTLRCQ